MARKSLGLDFCDIKIANGVGMIDEYEGMYINEVADKLNMSPFKAYINLVDKCNGTAGVYIKRYSTEEIIKKLAGHDKCLLMTDAWVQPKGVQNGAAYYGFIKFLLMAESGDISLESIINKMTKKTAERFNVKNRGTLEAGSYADITIFDYNKLKYNEDPISKPSGIKYVFINGREVISDGVKNADLLKNSGTICSY
jgi:N-acyl-D-amino-acid deacylase